MDRIERSAAVEAVEKLASERIAELPGGLVNAIYAALNALPPARFTREDVEKAAKAWCNHFGGDGWFTNFTDGDRKMYFEAATAALSAIGEVDHG